MTQWIRFEHGGEKKFGTLEGDTIAVHEGDMFNQPKSTSESVALGDVKILTPTEPSKIVALWNNFYALGQKLNLDTPPEPLYFIKASTSSLAGGEQIRRPASFDGKVIFEGELGIVIGKKCSTVSEAEAGDYIFGYTCVNDVTAVELLNKDASFAQWTRAKSFDTFGVMGPVVATGLDPATLAIVSVLNGDERQNYPVSDMVFQPHRLVSLVSQDLTLLPGDVIACGTSVGVGSMKPGSTINITIEGIGTISNTFD
ncbi:MAG: fumarylacetoacetate hydrolase family protein [SAR324 cluster bacterium]|nr:fumarylacetoacetate hydrolase family protein [SAR324 cluster bacterium]MCZ6842581.1 fumarylacetoacetate hydrolase family protein [SAR324 cluster bacterium]